MVTFTFFNSNSTRTQVFQQSSYQQPYQRPYQGSTAQTFYPVYQARKPVFQQIPQPVPQPMIPQPAPYQMPYQGSTAQTFYPIYQAHQPILQPMMPQPAPYQMPNTFQNPFNNPSSNIFNQVDSVMGKVDQFLTDVNTGTFQNMVNINPNAAQNTTDPAAAKYYNDQPISPEANIFNQSDSLDDLVQQFINQNGGTPLI